MSDLDNLVKETRAALIIAKSDGVLDSGEIIQIAVNLVQKLQKLTNLSGQEKKSILLHTLKKGLDESGGLDSLIAFTNVSPEMKALFEQQLLSLASSAVDQILSASSGKLDLRKPSINCFLGCLNKVKELLPKDQKLVDDAINFSKSILNKNTETTEVKVVV